MKFLNRNKDKFKKIVLVISDLHLGAGAMLNGKRNHLEDFHSDKELVDFINYYSTGAYASQNIELIINGDFLDLLSVPFIPYFDDEFWSEEASLSKLDMIYQAHSEVFEALNDFIGRKSKKIMYIIGNHDAELIQDSLIERFLGYFDDCNRENITLKKEITKYEPVKGVFIKHGHQYEIAHQYTVEESLIETFDNRKFFKPSWGSYYVINVVNKYKQDRHYVNQIRPIKNFLIHAMIFDTFFIIRFIFANAFYFFMVRFRHYFLMGLPWPKLLRNLSDELNLFEDFEKLTQEFFIENEEAKVLIVGHTHHPTYRSYSDGSVFINTGTWTKMTSLDFNNFNSGTNLTYAKIQVIDEEAPLEKFEENVSVNLYEWKGTNDLPYDDFL